MTWIVVEISPIKVRGYLNVEVSPEADGDGCIRRQEVRVAQPAAKDDGKVHVIVGAGTLGIAVEKVPGTRGHFEITVEVQ